MERVKIHSQVGGGGAGVVRLIRPWFLSICVFMVLIYGNFFGQCTFGFSSRT
jgi:hypothetical protein